MKDTVITARRKKIELWTFLACLGLSCLLNLGCILYYGTPFAEVFTQIGYVMLIAFSLYLIWTAVRLVVRLFRRKKQ